MCNRVSLLIRLWIELMLENWKQDWRPEYKLVKARIRNKTRAGLGVLIPLSQTLHVALLVLGWRSESERDQRPCLSLRELLTDGLVRSRVMNGSLFRSGRKLGSRIGGRVRKNREMSSGRVGPPMGGPMYASQCLVLGVYRNEGGSVPPSSHLWFMWEINTERSHQREQDTLRYC